MKVDEAVRLSNSNIIVLAVPNDFYDRQPFELFDGKILIDVSNRSTVYRKLELSQAEYLQSLLTKSTVVKAFNVISAYALETGGLQGSKEVFYAGDVHAAKEEVSGLIKSLGFSPVDKGNLRAAREIEDIPLQRFPLWKTPLLVSSILWGLLFILAFSK
jgi:predicted dinucleotide-binding enzyme